MVALGKWSQHAIDNIFLMKYGQGMSEPQITDHIAQNDPSHRDIKVTGIRYVLRCKQPSPGIPSDPKRKQITSTNVGSQYRKFKKNMSMAYDIQEGIMSQKRLHEQFLNRQNRLSKSPQLTQYQIQQDPLSCQLDRPWLTSFQASHNQLHDNKDKGTTSLTNYEILKDFRYIAKDFLDSLPPGVTTDTQDILSYYSKAPESTSQDSNVCLPTRNSSVDSFLHSFHGTREDGSFLTPNCVNSSTNTQLLTPTTSQDTYLPTDLVNSSTDTCISSLTFFNEPIDDIFKFPSMEQAETQAMPRVFDPSFGQESWDVPLKTHEQENEKKNFSDILDPNTYLEDTQIEEQNENTCHLIAPTHTGGYANSMKRHAEKKASAKCPQKQKEMPSHNFEACSIKANKFGGIRGSPLDNPQIMRENPLTHLFDSSNCDEYFSNNTGLLTNAIRPDDFLKSNESPIDLGTSTINLHNPEFHQPFILPNDTQFWTINRTEESNLTLHGSTPTSQVIINLFNPKFHSGCFINETFVPPKCSQEQLDTLGARSSLELA
ncbi:hypothetical protein EPUL_000474 [Erysiphe pulchra]|uniref:Uncharacterized protein n=1 Tax=Erysiphe pulchra TaxID=225359 RepID=A0A2S4Q0B2_9PEZI|nr:hypothetical protein EPUL_000474 [Erysiphe pulchra]